MKTENVVLMRNAQAALKGKWGLAIGSFVVYMIIVIGIQLIPIAGAVVGLIIGGPFALGLTIFSLSISRNQNAELNQIFKGFENFGTALAANLLMGIFTLLWMLLLIVPGVIALLSYSMTLFIIADDKSVGAMEAINKSKAMMEGHKAQLFRLWLRLSGLGLLCILTLGIGFLWLAPYAYVVQAKFYDDLKGEAETLTVENTLYNY